MRDAGVNVISLAAGQLGEDTPADVRKAGKAAIDNGHTRYTTSNGSLDLRQAICAKYHQEWKTEYSADQVLVSNGAKHAIANVLLATVGSGDEVIILAPYYPSYPEMIRLTGALPVVVGTEIANGFKPDTKAMRKAVSKKTKAIIVNSPNNPTGAVYDRQIIEGIAEIAIEHDLLLISDDIYEKIVFPPSTFASALSLGETARNRLVVTSGVSKSYAMTGWRLGWACGPADIIERAGLVQSHMTSNACSISQQAGIAALQQGDGFIAEINSKLIERRKAAMEILFAVDKLRIEKAEGAFYLFPDISPFLKKQCKSSLEFCHMLLEEQKVAVVPGEAFGAPGHIRISFAGEPKLLRLGCSKIAITLEASS